MSKEMKTFVFRPQEYGQNTYIVMAFNEEQARSFVHKHCIAEDHFCNYEPDGWGSIDYVYPDKDDFASGPMYLVEVYGVGEVVENNNS